MSKKENNEITLKIKCDLKEFYNIMEEKHFDISDKFFLEDYYFIPENLKLKEMSVREILAKAVIVRKRTCLFTNNEKIMIVFKRKTFDEMGNILKQDSVKCYVLNNNEAFEILKAIGYKMIMNINENDIVYTKDDFNIAVKNIQNGNNLIEIETTESEELNTIQKLISKVNEIGIPVYTDNYFVKKAEIELEKVLNKEEK